MGNIAFRLAKYVDGHDICRVLSLNAYCTYVKI